jgi:hypothetical protein
MFWAKALLWKRPCIGKGPSLGSPLPEMSQFCLYFQVVNPRQAKYPGGGNTLGLRIVYHRLMFVLNEVRLLAHYPLIIVIDVKHTKCEINNFSVTCMHATCAIGTEILWWFLASNSLVILSLIAIKNRVWPSRGTGGGVFTYLSRGLWLRLLPTLVESPTYHCC